MAYERPRCPVCRMEDLRCTTCGKQKKPEPDGVWQGASDWFCNIGCAERRPDHPPDAWCEKHAEVLSGLKKDLQEISEHQTCSDCGAPAIYFCFVCHKAFCCVNGCAVSTAHHPCEFNPECLA